MDKRVLVTYASEFGSPEAVAEAIGHTLCEAGATVDVRSVVDVSDLRPYGAALVGSGIYNGAWLPEAVHFVKYHAATLSHMPVAYFLVCATMRSKTEERQEGARSFLEPVLQLVPQVQPIAIGLFAGKIDSHRLPWQVRVWMRLTTDLRQGDSRDWEAIRAWTRGLEPVLLYGH